MTPTRETFYSNLNGTDTLDIALIASGAPLCVLLRFSVTSALVYFGGISLKPWQNFVVEFFTLVLPCILGVTLISTQTPALLATLIVPSLTLLIIIYRHSSKHLSSKAHDRLTLETLLNTKHTTRNKLQFVTAFRVYALIVTAISILAVDFVAFPRRLAKTEIYGTGLMDAGVGVFTLANALVSPEARGTYETVKGVRSGLESLLKSGLTALPIIILGFIRLASVNASDYHVHVSEYGVHWNFFFTLATVSILSSICLTLVSPHMSGILSLVLAAGYQMQLTNQGLGEFVLYGDDGQGSRNGLLNANREGLVSCIGYLVIYLAGVQLGRFLFLPRSTLRDWCNTLLVLCLVDAILWGMLYTSATSIEPVCRRSANLSYIIWTLAYCVHMLACFLLVEIITSVLNQIVQTTSRMDTNDSSKVHPPIMEAELISAVNRNQLPLFLLANLMTGVVNMSIDTIGYDELSGVAIVTAYMFVLCSAGSALRRYNISFKFGAGNKKPKS